MGSDWSVWARRVEKRVGQLEKLVIAHHKALSGRGASETTGGSRPGVGPMAGDSAKALISEMREVFGDAAWIGPLAAVASEVIALRKELREHRGLRYRGTWAQTTSYEPGDFVTHSGSLWAALEPSQGVRPGGGRAWQLAAKAGRNGKDLRK